MIIGLSAPAKSGKDALAEALGFPYFALADALKDDLAVLIWKMYSINVKSPSPKEKEIIRPLLVAHGAGMRARYGVDYWVERLFGSMLFSRSLRKDPYTVISDVRYPNEAARINATGGLVFRIHRPGYGPVNDEEAGSLAEIDKLPYIIHIQNDKKISDLAEQVKLHLPLA